MNSKALEEDGQLMRRVAAGDAQAYRLVVDAHLQAITRYAHRLLQSPHEAEEVAQETFLRAWQHASQYRPQARLTTWLHKIAHHLTVDRLRRKQPRALGDAIDEAPASGRPSSFLERKQTAEAVQAALDSLPPRQRSAITLVHHQGMTNREAAEVMGVGVEAIESLLSRGRRTLKTVLAEQLRGWRDEL